MGARSNPLGPLQHSDLTQIGETDGVIFWSPTRPPEITPLSADVDYTIEMGDRHDLLSSRKLGTPQLGWAIMERNKDLIPEEFDMRLWPNDFVPGITIKISPRLSLRRRGIIP